MSRGFSLIELMITVAILGITAAGWSQLDHYQGLTSQQRAREAMIRALENEIERAVACRDRACLARWRRAEVADDSLGWARVAVARRVDAGPAGTQRVTVSAPVPGTPRRVEIMRLVWVAR